MVGKIDLNCLMRLCWLLVVFGTVTVTGQAFTHSAVLDADNRYHLFWRFDITRITFEVQVQTLGFVGLGFSPNGGMSGSDIIICWVDDSSDPHVLDTHAVGNRPPISDLSQDTELISGTQNSTHTTVRFSRALHTCDKDDKRIEVETIRVIWAYHENDPDTNDRIQYHGQSRGVKSIFLLSDPNPIAKIPSEVSYLDLINKEVPIPTSRTLYWCSSFDVPKLDRKHHVIKLEPVIQSGHESLVHHILIYGCLHMVSNSSRNTGHECYHPNMPQDWWVCNSVAFAWAIGGGSIDLPDHAGVPLGLPDDPTMFVMETHYDNPALKSGIVDSSGLRLTLTPELRTFDAGVIQMGAVVDSRQVIPPYSTKYVSTGHCLPQCTELVLANMPEGIKIFGVTLHSHLLGRAMRLRHFRNGKEMEKVVQDQNYDFNLQEQRFIKEEVTILPGDHLITECDYDSSDKTEITSGGLGTTEEMCLAFVTYYPRINLTECTTVPTQDYLNTFRNLTEFGVSHWSILFNDYINWKDEKIREELHAYTNKVGVDGFQMNCRKGPVFHMDMRIPVSLPYTESAPEVEEECKKTQFVSSASNIDKCIVPVLLICLSLIIH